MLRKELTDALRDRRTLLTVLLSSVLMGPLILVAISGLVASLEARAEQREIYVAGLAPGADPQEFSPSGRPYVVKEAPSDYESELRASRFTDPLVVVPPTFQASLAKGESPIVENVSDSANQRSEASTGRIARLLGGFGRERAILDLALRGVAVQVLEPIDVEERDLASTQTRATRITGMLPYFVMMAVLYGALNAALDTTAGERERGSRLNPC